MIITNDSLPLLVHVRWQGKWRQVQATKIAPKGHIGTILPNSHWKDLHFFHPDLVFPAEGYSIIAAEEVRTGDVLADLSGEWNVENVTAQDRRHKSSTTHWYALTLSYIKSSFTDPRISDLRRAGTERIFEYRKGRTIRIKNREDTTCQPTPPPTSTPTTPQSQATLTDLFPYQDGTIPY